MKRSARIRRPIVSADGTGVVSHAGSVLLRELARSTGLVDAWNGSIIGTYKAAPVHQPGQVLADLAVAIADGATHIAHLDALRDQPALFGVVASDPRYGGCWIASAMPTLAPCVPGGRLPGQLRGPRGLLTWVPVTELYLDLDAICSAQGLG